MGIRASDMKDGSVRKSLHAALADGRIGDQEFLDILASTLDGKKGITPTEKNDLQKLKASSTMSPTAKAWLNLGLCLRLKDQVQKCLLLIPKWR